MSSSNTETELSSATRGFDHLFTNEIIEAKELFSSSTESPFHLIGLGVCSFLEAALGMESMQMTEASKLLALAEAATRKAAKDKERVRGSGSRSSSNGSGTGGTGGNGTGGRFAEGLEWEILNADAVVLLGLTNALSESYMGYLQCLYALNNAHSKFTKLYKTVFPTGLDGYSTPSPATPSITPKSSTSNLSAVSVSNSVTPSVAPAAVASKKSSFFGRWGGIGIGSGTSSAASSTLTVPQAGLNNFQPDGPIEDLIVAGTAFGFGLFNLVFSLLPKKIQSVVGFFGFKHSRHLALQALAVSAAKKDVHSVFAGLVLMTYHGVVLLLAGFQADEAHIIRQYRGVVDSIEPRYPNGSLWILNRAKILRMCYDPEGAVRVLKDGLKPGRHSFAQADTLLLFELAWTYLSQRRYAESAETFLKMTEVNSWSHATYYFIAAGCYISLALSSDSNSDSGSEEQQEGREKHFARAQELFDAIPGLIDKKKVGGKDLPTEVLIKKRIAFYQEKQKRRGRDEKKYVECIRISPAEELAIFWNTHARISPSNAEAHIRDWASLTPPVTISSPYIHSTTTAAATTSGSEPADLDTPDELALRLLLLGIVHRTLGCAVLIQKSRKYKSGTGTSAGEDVDADAAETGTSGTTNEDDKYTSPENARAALASSRAFLAAAHASQASIKVSTWIGGVAMFELAVLDLKEVEVIEYLEYLENQDQESSGGPKGENEMRGEGKYKQRWEEVLRNAKGKLDVALGLATNSTDLSSRLDSRIAMLRDEIGMKAEAVGVGL